MATAYETKLASFKTKSDDAADDLADIYKDILTSIAPGIAKAQAAAETLSPSVSGITELTQVLQIMNNGFKAKAEAIIAAATANDEPAA